MKMSNRVIFAAAGNGKTYNICKEAKSKSKISKKSILLLSYTNEGVKSIKNEYAKQNKGVIDSNIVIKTWYNFLLTDLIKPYQCLLNLKTKHYNSEKVVKIPENFIKSIAFYQNDKPKWYNAGHVQYFLNDAKDIRKDEVSQLAYLCNKHSLGKVVNRLSLVYSDIYIDELQDYAGWDLELFSVLFSSNINITCVGDYRQATYRTNNSQKNRQYRDDKIINFFKAKEQQKECIIKYSLKTKRFNNHICNYVNKIFNDGNLVCTDSDNQNEGVSYVGVYVIESKYVNLYCETYHPTILKYNANTVTNVEKCMSFNYGSSKGQTFDRVLIYPISTILPFIIKNGRIEANQTKSKFYVACTRAKFSIVFVVDEILQNSDFEESRMILNGKSIPCYKFKY